MASAPSLSDFSAPHLIHPSEFSGPTNDDIEAVIQMATSSSKTQDSRQLAPLRDTRAQLFVGNLPYRVRWQDLKDLFRRAGTVLRADVSLGPDNRSRGYGTVLLATAEDAGRAIDMLNGYCWQTRVLEVRPDRLGASVDEMGGNLAIRGANGQPSGFPPSGNPFDENTFGQDVVGGNGMKTLFVGNLPFHIQWQDLKDLFRAAGAVARADVTVGPDGRSRGFGTVSFVTEDGAERARRMFDGYEFNGRPLKVHYDKFSPSAAPVPLVGVQIPVPSTLSQYDALASHLQSLQLESHQLGRQNERLSQVKLDGLLHSQLDSLMDPLRRADLDPITSSQLEVLLSRSIAPTGSRSSELSLSSSSLTSASLTSPSPALLHTQSLAPSAVHSLAPTPTHPHSLTSSPHLGFSNNSSTNFAPLSLSLGADALTIKLPHPGVADSLNLKLNTDMKLGSDMHPLSSNKSRASSSSSPRPSVSAGSSQAQNYTTTTSSGSSRPSFSTTSSLTDGTNFSQRPSFGASQSQRPSFSSSTSQRPAFGSTSQRPSFSGGSTRRPTFSASSLVNEPFFDDEREGQESVSHPVSMGTSQENSGSSSSSSFSLSHTLARPKSDVGNDTPSTSPPESGGWPSMSSPRQTSPKTVVLAHSILNSDLSNKSQSLWGASEIEPSQGPTPAKVEGSGNTDATATAVGSLSFRRAKALASKAAEKNRSSSPNTKLTSPSPQKQTQASPQKPSQASSRRQPGPIALPPPCTFTLPHPPVLSPYPPPHPHSPMYHAGYTPSHPMSPLHRPGVRSPIHHPAVSPLHPPYHMHYGVITPHGLPPITPSMPPFTFLQPTNGRANTTEQQSSAEGYQAQAQAGRSEAPPPPSPYHLPPHSQIPYSSHLPSHMFSPGIPLSPGIMVPISPGYPSSVTMVPLTPGGVPMTPGVTMTPGAFWPQAPWINPAPGAPVHADEQWHNHGHPPNSGGDYFPPQGGPDDDTGYFPPVCSIAKEIFKEGSEFHSSEQEGDSQSKGSSACAGTASPAPKSTQEGRHIDSDRGHREARRTASPQPNRSTTTEGGHVPRRAGLTHRPESDPSNGKRQS